MKISEKIDILTTKIDRLLSDRAIQVSQGELDAVENTDTQLEGVRARIASLKEERRQQRNSD